MDKRTRYLFIGLAAVAVFLFSVTVHLQWKKVSQMDRWLDQTQRRLDHLEKPAPWVDDVGRLLDRVLPENKNAQPTG